MSIINKSTRAGLMALVLGCGAYSVAPTANAETQDTITFAFHYDARSLASEAGRNALDRRLTREAAKHCRSDSGLRTMVVEIRGCQRDLVKAVRFALSEEAKADAGRCTAVTVNQQSLRAAVCAFEDYDAI